MGFSTAERTWGPPQPPVKQTDTLYLECGDYTFDLELDENCMHLFAERIEQESATAEDIIDFLHGVMRTMVEVENHTGCDSAAFRAGKKTRRLTEP